MGMEKEAAIAAPCTLEEQIEVYVIKRGWE
jgi:hypothetical protein